VTLVIEHEASLHRFCTRVDGAQCVLDYTLSQAGQHPVMTITHTGVPPEVAGRGIASALAQSALAMARDEGWKVVPACSYVAVWIERHPEFRSLCVA
jgi:hypothetical protein